ncbi:zinc-binding alcohol dehydrogenase family protein [Hylemonella gracilis]|uniref:Zinc-type alcohol dehydrogenase-like protein n=1 Tax=Hylemonella gracilis TaxID=80880 RepID=A0A4P6UNM3_9BURK|nr:zinc-binding alcohol dehydrogenase family protein [Hylemonella gracilis]QBK05715.1 zinc-binding alcohol dehydrogenase family protein [Hylemonella gracilis]
MKAIGHLNPLPLSDAQALIDLTLPDPEPGPHDLLVRVRAVSVNPVDVKVRAGMAPPSGQPRVLGWDAAGDVLAIGSEVRGFAPGDRVWYAGALQRNGSNAQLQTVDARIVGPMPRKLDYTAAAALPLTGITAWELLFDRLGVPPGGGAGQRLLVVGGAGGVGSILVQLARQFTQLEVVATASRPASQAWARDMGAHHVIDHHQPLDEALAAVGLSGGAHLVASLTHTEAHYPALVRTLRPQGRMALIDDPRTLDARPLKMKSASLHWEFMFTRPMFETEDMATQGRLLARLAEAVDAGQLRSTVTRDFGELSVTTLREAHAWIESGQAIGKGVLRLG